MHKWDVLMQNRDTVKEGDAARLLPHRTIISKPSVSRRMGLCLETAESLQSLFLYDMFGKHKFAGGKTNMQTVFKEGAKCKR